MNPKYGKVETTTERNYGKEKKGKKAKRRK